MVSDREGQSAGARWVSLAMLLALPLVFALYANSLRGPFQFDDRHAIVENPALRTAAVDWSWLGSRAWMVGGGHYRPLTSITYGLNLRFGGLDPFGFHLFNVVLHWGATAILLGLLWRLFGRVVPALVGGLLFAVTPANSEAVNYLAARSSLLVGLWGVAAVAAFILLRRAQADGRAWAAFAAGAGALIALALGLVSKELAVTIPLIWLCYDMGWSRSLSWKALAWPYAVGAALAVAFVGGTGYYRTIWAVLSGASGGERDLWVNLWTQLAIFPLHLTVFVWPFSLNILRDVPVFDSPWHLQVALGLAIVVGGTVLGFRWLIKASDTYKQAGWLLLWFIIALLPTMLYPLHALFQEHRDYLPWMGLAGVTGLAASALVERLGRAPGVRWASLGFGVIVLGILATSTVSRNGVWTDTLRLWSDAAAKSPAHPVVQLNLGAEHARRGDGERALTAYQEAIRLQPDYGLAYQNVGLLYLGRGEYAQARVAFERAAALTPDAADPLAALGTVYTALGEPALANDALARAAAALGRRPHPPAARLSVADAYAKSGRWREAEPHYRAVLAQEHGEPSFLSARAHLGLGYLAERTGRPDEALAAYAEALEIDPRLNDARFNSANVLLTAGRYPEATAAYEQVLANAPAFFPARFNLGRLYEREGRLEEARREYQAFLRDAPPGPAYASARQYAQSRVGSPGGDDQPGPMSR